MKTKIAYALLAIISPSLLFVGCTKQSVEPTIDPTEMVSIKFNTFLKEGDNIRPMSLGTRAATGTLANGFYLYAHAHTKPFDEISGNTYIQIYDNTPIGADGTFAVPRFWLADKNLYYTFQAYSATGTSEGNIAPAGIQVSSPAPNIFSTTNRSSLGQSGYNTTDILSATVTDLKLGDNPDVSVNLYFEHRLCRLAFSVQRLNTVGPTMENVSLSLVYSGNGPARGNMIGWMPSTVSMANSDKAKSGTTTLGEQFNIPSSETNPIFVDDLFYGQQGLLNGWATIEMKYQVSGSAVTTLTTPLPEMTLVAGSQYNIIVGYMVESDMLVIKGVTLSNWDTKYSWDVPEYK